MSTTSEALCAHFSRFGSVKDALIPKYRGVSAGLGIVNFNHPRDVEFVMAQSTHIIDSVQVEVSRLQWDRPLQDHATFGDEEQYSQVEESPRLFVSRLRESVTAEMLETFCSQFGTVTKVRVHGFNGERRPQYHHHDRSTRSQSRDDQAAATTSGYGFVSFDSKQALDAAMPPGCNRTFHLIHGAMVEVKRAIPYSRRRSRS
jgi:RNA recognition motif-containing protein